jgi:hypothetical protein
LCCVVFQRVYRNLVTYLVRNYQTGQFPEESLNGRTQLPLR